MSWWNTYTYCRAWIHLVIYVRCTVAVFLIRMMSWGKMWDNRWRWENKKRNGGVLKVHVHDTPLISCSPFSLFVLSLFYKFGNQLLRIVIFLCSLCSFERPFSDIHILFLCHYLHFIIENQFEQLQFEHCHDIWELYRSRN